MENLNFFRLLINRIYFFLFKERFSKKLHIEFPNNIYRWDLIQHIINKYNFDNYLEIGCDKDQSFSKIKIKNKVGVDPVSGGTIRSTSNDFFSINKDYFDIIFIDGLHIYKQVKKDILNSINCLNSNGIILVHDCMPDSLGKQAVPRYKMQWNGDVWKAIVELRQLDDLEIYTCEIDQGIGIITKKTNSSKLILNKPMNKIKFKDYFYNYKEYMRVISLDKFKEIF